MTLSRVIDSAITAIQEYGHGTGANLNKFTGTLCLNGALLHGSRVRVRNSERINGVFYMDPTPEGVSRPLAQADYDHAVRAVARVIPEVPGCFECWDLGCSHASFRDPVRAISHYNDTHCDGGEGALLILKHARESL